MRQLIAVNGTMRIGGVLSACADQIAGSVPEGIPRPAMTLGINQYERQTGSLVEAFTMLTSAKPSPPTSIDEG